MIAECVTDGEKLCQFIEHRLISKVKWNVLETELQYINKCSNYRISLWKQNALFSVNFYVLLIPRIHPIYFRPFHLWEISPT